MPKLLPRHYAKILYAVTRDEKKRDAAVASFIRFVRRRRAMKKFPAIIKEFFHIAREAEGIESAAVTTARHMPNNEIAEAVKKILGCDAEIEIRSDDSLVGGIIVETRTRRIDASAKNQLFQLSNHLAQKK